MTRCHEMNGTLLVSFSGIDGAGKSTQIDALSSCLEHNGFCVGHIRFWDDVARLKRIREASGHVIFKGDKGVGSPSAPIHRRDKNVQSPLMTMIRLFIYLADALSLRLVVNRALRSGDDVVMFDRYLYDELANLNLQNPVIRGYARLLLTLVPRPHVSFVLDADPVQARARKPEYPLEFLRKNREGYLRLSALTGGITIINPLPVEDVHRLVTERVFSELPESATPAHMFTASNYARRENSVSA